MTRSTKKWQLTGRIGFAAACVGTSAPALGASSQHAVQAGFDLASQSTRDDALVPLAYTGPRAALTARYFGDFGNGLLLGDGRFGFGYMRNGAGDEGITFSWGLHASYLPILAEGSWGLALGPATGWDNETFLFADWDDAHPYWIGTLWLGPGLRTWHYFNEHSRVDLGFEFGLIGFQSRPEEYRLAKQETSYDVLPFYGFPTRDLEFGTALDWEIARVYVDFSKLRTRSRAPEGWGFGSEFSWARATEPRPAFMFNASVRVSYAWRL